MFLLYISEYEYVFGRQIAPVSGYHGSTGLVVPLVADVGKHPSLGSNEIQAYKKRNSTCRVTQKPTQMSPNYIIGCIRPTYITYTQTTLQSHTAHYAYYIAYYNIKHNGITHITSASVLPL